MVMISVIFTMFVWFRMIVYHDIALYLE